MLERYYVKTHTSTKTKFYEFLVVVVFLLSLIEDPKDLLFIFLVLNAIFMTLYHVKAVQDDIFAKLLPT